VTGKDRKGQERTGKDRKGQERTGKKRKQKKTWKGEEKKRRISEFAAVETNHFAWHMMIKATNG